MTSDTVLPAVVMGVIPLVAVNAKAEELAPSRVYVIVADKINPPVLSMVTVADPLCVRVLEYPVIFSELIVVL